MFGVSFDTLWQRHKRRQKVIRNISIAACLLCLFCALGVWDYTRTKVEHYADWVDCNGVAKGIMPLNDNQMSHRYYSYKFEYSRVPFGEKGFYSWRLNKVSIVNSQGVISNYIPENHDFFYPIQEYKYADGYVSEIINRDSYNRVVIRYTIKDDFDHNMACIVDMEGKEKRQGSAYLNSSTTAFISDANSNASMSKIKRFHYSRNKEGYITKVTYHANDADELEESAIGDNNNIYGKLYDLDKTGRVCKVTYINNEGIPMTDKFGVGYIRYNNASFEGKDTIEYLGSDSVLTYNAKKYARLISKLDKYGNPVEQMHEGSDGSPCYNSDNIYRQVMTFDNKGCMTEMKFFDFTGNPSYCSDNYAIQRAKYDSKGRYIEVSHYGTDGKPCYNHQNYCISRVEYNSNDCIVKQTYFDTNGKPCVQKEYGMYGLQIKYDDYNYIIEQSIWDKKNKPSISPYYGVHLQKNEYDEYHQLIACTSYDTNGNRCINTREFCCEAIYTYDNRGNLIKLETFDTEGEPCISKRGYAIITYKYDNYGNCIEESYFGKNGEPIYINMCASKQADYFPNGLLKEERFYNENGQLCLNNNWYAIGRYEYDNNGHQVSISFFDIDTIPCYYKDGLYSRMNHEYDQNGNIIKESFYDANGKASNISNGLYSIAKYKYDKSRRITEYAYFDENEKPCYYNREYHIMHVKFDPKGNVVHKSILGTNGEPTLSPGEKWGVIQCEYDAKNNIKRTDYKDTKGNNINLENSGYSTEILSYDEFGRIIEYKYFDNNGTPCMINIHPEARSSLTFSSCSKKYDQMGNCVEISYFDINRRLNKAMPYAKKYLSYDELGRIIEEKHKNAEGKLAPGGNHHMSILKYKYNNNFVSEIMFYDTDSILQADLHQTVKNGIITKKEIRDKNNKLKSINLVGFIDLKCAIMTDSIDEYGRNLKRCYYGEDGELGNIAEGVAILRNTYDCFGRLTSQELFDKNNKPVVGKIVKFHKRNIRYNDKGLIAEDSYFDCNNNYVNTPYLNSYCREILNYDSRGVLDPYSSKWFFSIEGKAVDEKELNTLTESVDIRKANGALIFANVELPGLFIDNGYEGLFCILEWNEWTMYDDITKFSEVFSTSISKNKHLLMVPVKNGYVGNVINTTFPPGTLGIRIMDSNANALYNDLLDVYENYKNTNN